MKKVLIVDDQAFIRSMLGRHAQQLGEVEIIEATNGNEALGKAKVTMPDLILMDIVMPNKDGIEAIRDLKAYDKTAHIPILVISSHGDQEKVDTVMQLGAEKFIDKAELQSVDFVGILRQYLG